MTEQQPDEPRDDLAETRSFQPIDPYNIGDYADFRPGGADFGAAGDGEDDEDDEPYPSLRERVAAFGKARLALAGAAVVLVVGGIAWGTSAALASSDGGSPNAGPPAAAPTAPGQHPKKPAQAARVTITAVAANSFTGTNLRGKTVTVAYGDDTKFGTKARPLSPGDLVVGLTVTVLGEEDGDTITASVIGTPVKKAGAPVPGVEAPSGTPGATAGGTPSG